MLIDSQCQREKPHNYLVSVIQNIALIIYNHHTQIKNTVMIYLKNTKRKLRQIKDREL